MQVDREVVEVVVVASRNSVHPSRLPKMMRMEVQTSLVVTASLPDCPSAHLRVHVDRAPPLTPSYLRLVLLEAC